MNKNKYVGVFIAIVVLGIIFWAVSSSKKNEQTPEGEAVTVSTISVTSVTSPASAVSAGAKAINWQTTNYPKNAGLNINLIRKISDSPRQFELVRALAVDTQNDGNETWIPQAGENVGDIYVQVTCSTTYQFASGCSLASEPIKAN